MKANRAQTCSIFGLTKYEFDALVAEGLPATRSGAGRGHEWALDTVQAHRWLVQRAVRLSASGQREAVPATPGQSFVDTATGEVLNFDKERARLTKEQADKLERERHLDERRLGSVPAMRRLIERLVGGANARLGALPAKLAPVVRPDDPVTARRHLELAVEEVRAELRRLAVEEADEDAA